VQAGSLLVNLDRAAMRQNRRGVQAARHRCPGPLRQGIRGVGELRHGQVLVA